jgi:hypothetical protein
VSDAFDSVTVAEFDRIDAAHRLIELLALTARPAGLHTYTAGNRHRYDIHRVVAPGDTEFVLQTAWRIGYRDLCGQPGAPRSAHWLRHARRLASAAWRAALLVTGPTRTDSPGLRIPDLDTAAALALSGRMLDVPVRMTTRADGQLVLMLPGGVPRLRCFAEVAARPMVGS